MKLQFTLSGICLSFILCGYGAVATYTLRREGGSNRYLNTLQIIRKYGYPAEGHVVQTADGYLLEMHRIPHGLNPEVKRRPPILIQHGLLSSSADFVILGANDSIAFRLADSGYDVWLGNIRGNTYSRAHINIDPTERKFWNFSWHESAIYDLPAQIDFICNVTKEEKITYIGHSMGTTMFFVLTSTIPEYNDKIELSLLMATVAYVKHIKSPLVRVLEPVYKAFKDSFDLIGNGAFLRHTDLIDFLTKIICDSVSIGTKLCVEGFFLFSGQDPTEFDKELLDVYLGHYPAGYSLKGLLHYAQLIDSGKFQRYDYGLIGNQMHYGSPTPPDYEVEKIRVPMYFYQGKNDYLSTLQDVKKLSKRLSTLRDIRVIEYSKFSHLDFVISVNVTEYVNDKLISDIESFYSRRKKAIMV